MRCTVNEFTQNKANYEMGMRRFKACSAARKTWNRAASRDAWNQVHGPPLVFLVSVRPPDRVQLPQSDCSRRLRSQSEDLKFETLKAMCSGWRCTWSHQFVVRLAQMQDHLRGFLMCFAASLALREKYSSVDSPTFGCAKRGRSTIAC